MPCKKSLSVFPQPFKFGTAPVYIDEIDYETQEVNSVVVSSGFIQLPPCPYPIELGFVNSKSGRDYLTFTGKHLYYTEISDSVIFEDATGTELLASRGKIRERITVQSQYLSLAWIAQWKEILQSIHVWMLADGKYYDVRIVDATYPTGQSGERMGTMSFDLLIGKLIQIQTA